MDCLSPLSITHEHDTRRGPVKVTYTVPCGKCVFCCASRRSEWATRLYWEGRQHYCKQFITLTYSDKYCPDKVRKNHVQNFFKRLRKAGYSFKYYAVGEYGSTTGRPHYHVIMFGEVPEKAIRQAWSFYSRRTKKFDPIGICHIGQVTEASVMYCLGYVVHGAKKGNRTPFSLMSKGLGKSYLFRTQKVLKDYTRRWTTKKGVKKEKVYQRLVDKDFPRQQMIKWHKSGWKNYTMIYEEKRRLPRYYKRKIFTGRELMWIRKREEKESWRKEVERIRKLAKTRIKDPQAYLLEQKKIAASRLRLKSKENLTI